MYPAMRSSTLMFFFFFFQAEDGIRDYKVTGVQTCALPIFTVAGAAALDKAFNSLSTSPAPSEIINEELKHPHSGRSKSNPFRPWSAITAIVLHQTAAKIGETAKAWHNVPIHFGVTRAGKI